jgi:hypothetical protein
MLDQCFLELHCPQAELVGSQQEVTITPSPPLGSHLMLLCIGTVQDVHEKATFKRKKGIFIRNPITYFLIHMRYLFSYVSFISNKCLFKP